MSKVYSFRLNDDNPREAQAREVIEAWAAEGYSLRHMIVEVILFYKEESRQGVAAALLDQLQELILYLDKKPTSPSGNELSNSFMISVKQVARKGLVIEDSSIY